MKLTVGRRIQTFLLDTLFPINCLGCGQPGIWLCDFCLQKIPSKNEQVCPVCERKITPDGRVCSACRKKSAIDALLAASYYETGIMPGQSREYQFIADFQKRELVSQAVHYYKYRFIQDLRVPLGKIILKSLLNSQLPLPDFIIPVPLHKKRLRWRGFNQAELLADYLSVNLTPGFEIPVAGDLLTRVKYTRPQMAIKNYSRRKENLKNAFAINPANQQANLKIFPNMNCDSNLCHGAGSCFKNKTVLIVDDIATTGSTLFECAKVLKQNRAKEVNAVVIARQGYK